MAEREERRRNKSVRVKKRNGIYGLNWKARDTVWRRIYGWKRMEEDEMEWKRMKDEKE